MDEKVRAARRTPESSPFRGDARIAGLRACALPRDGGAGREGMAPGTLPGPDAVGGVAGRPRGRKDASRARPPSLPLCGALPLACGPERSEVRTQTQVGGWGCCGLSPFSTYPPSPALGSPPYNEQLVENLHFMKIALKDKGVSLYAAQSFHPGPFGNCPHP